MQNVEFKCELRDPELATAVCRNLGAVHIATLEQTDTYYRIPDGRLKKRECRGEPTEWIFYNRDDIARAKISHFRIYSEAEAKARFGERPLPVWVEVVKRRELWMYKMVRIHLDEVVGLGHFFELEAMVTRRQNVARCHEIVQELRQKFAPTFGELIAVSYSDLLAQDAA